MLQIIEANPVKYTNEYKQSVNSVLDQVKQGLLSKRLNETLKLEKESIPQKLNIKQQITLEFSEMDLEDDESI